MKMPKANKKKRAATLVSPLNTHVNSRSGSEARKFDVDEDPSDSRSNSGSGRGSASRDITPNTHHSATMPELSERERRKVAKEEEMFRRQEEEQSGKQGKKKRNSGGSTLHTPSESKPKPPGFGARGYTDASTPKPSGLPSKPGRKPKTNSKPTPKTITKIVKRPTPNYVTTSVQCDMDKEEAEAKSAACSPRKPYLSLTTRLLQRCALNNTRRRSQPSPSQASKSSPDATMDIDETSVKQSSVTPEPVEAPQTKDVEMQDAGDANGQHQHVQLPNGKSPSLDHPPSLPVNPPAPPWPSQPSHTSKPPDPHEQPLHKSPEMHISMPPPPSNPFGPSNAQPTSTSLTMTPTSIAGTPASALPPALIHQTSSQSAAAASPMKKKMSLSDYTKRNKAKDKENVEAVKSERESSPASVVSAGGGGVVPPLKTTGGIGGESAVVEDVGMEDAPATSAG